MVRARAARDPATTTASATNADTALRTMLILGPLCEKGMLHARRRLGRGSVQHRTQAFRAFPVCQLAVRAPCAFSWFQERSHPTSLSVSSRPLFHGVRC